jgi:hypothetical protein
VKPTIHFHQVPRLRIHGAIPLLPQYVFMALRTGTILHIFAVPDELHSLYSSPNIVRMIKSRRMRWTGHVARMGEGRGVYRFLVGKPEGKRPLGRPRRRGEDNIKLDLREIGIDGANWIRLAQDRIQ